MRYYFVLLFLWSAGLTAQDGEWKTLEQPFLRLSYDLPAGWYVGGKAGASVCADCRAATVNLDVHNEFNMVVVAGDQPLETLEAQPIQGQLFAPVAAPRGFYNTSQYSFMEAISTWQPQVYNTDGSTDPTLRRADQVQRDPKVVWRYSLEFAPYRYVLYFSGDLASLERNRSTIERILETVQPLP